MTETETQIKSDRILKESERQTKVIRAETELQAAAAQRELTLQSLERKALEDKALAETARLNMITTAEGNLRRAQKEVERDIQLAIIERTKTIESLVKLEITKGLEIFQEGVEANVTASQLEQRGIANAREELQRTRAKTIEYELLQGKLGMSDKAMVSLLLYRALKKSDAKTVLLDYAKQPLMQELGQMTSPVISVDAKTT